VIIATSGEKGRGGPVSKRTKIVLAIIGALVLGLGAVVAFGLASAAAEVETGVARTDTLSVRLIVSGELAAGQRVDVYAGTQGIVESVAVEDGDIVEEGDVLATIEAEALKAQVAQAKAAVAQANAGLAQANAGLAQANGQKGTVAAAIKAAEAAVTAAKSGLSSATKVRDASKDARDTAKAALDAANPADPIAYSAAEQAFLQADIAYQQAKVGVDAANVQLAQAKSGLTQAKAPGVTEGIRAARDGVTAAQASVAAARAGLALAEQSLADATITAPIGGKVEIAPTPADAAAMATGGGTSSLAKGSVVAPGSPVFSIINPNAMVLKLNVDESEVGKLQLGQKATVTLNAFPGEVFPAEVTRIGNKAGSTLTGGTVFPVELSIVSDSVELKVGMKGDATVTISEETSALTIPIRALFSEGTEDFVFVVDDEGVLTKTVIEIGTMTDAAAEVKAGLQGGEIVAFAGEANLVDGMKIEPTAEPSE